MRDINDQVTEAVKRLREQKISFHPVHLDGPRAKQPMLPEWRHLTKALPTDTEINNWFVMGGTGLGLIGGRVSGGLIHLDVEGRAVSEGVWDQLLELATNSGLRDPLDKVMAGCTASTPSGGLHISWRRADGEGVPNAKLARREATAQELAINPKEKFKVLVEVKSEGGYVVAPPAADRAYTHGGPDTIVTLEPEVSDALLEMVRVLDSSAFTPAPRAEHVGDKPQDGSVRPGDDFEARTTWGAILKPHGWTEAYERYGTRYWTRPGKSQGVSATTGHAQDRDRIYVFSSSTDFEVEVPYTKFGAYALLNHGGDHSEAAKQLRKDGYGKDVEFDVSLPETAPTADTENPRPVNNEGMPLIRPELTYDVSPALNHIRKAAYADVLCPDQVLHSTLDVLASYTSVKIAVDTGMRSPIQPNKATAIVGPPGTGKGAGRGASKKILPLEQAPDVVKEEMAKGLSYGENALMVKEYRRPSLEFPSTGEGMVESYYETVEVMMEGSSNKTKKVKQQIHEGSCHFIAEEAQDFVTQGRKNSSITFPTFRSLAFDDHVGQSGASVETRRKLEKSTYRAVFTLGFQPDVFTELLTDDHIGVGTPVRFDVCAAAGVKLPEERVVHPGVWDRALLTLGMERPPEVTLDEELKHEIYVYERSLQEGERTEHPLRVHRTRRVVSRATLIALLEGVTHIDRRIWDISVELYDASVAAMEWLLERRRTSERKRSDAKREEAAGTKVAEANAVAEAQNNRITQLLEDAAKQIAGRMRSEGERELAPSEAWRRITVRSRRNPIRDHYGDAAKAQEAIWEIAEENGWLTFDGGKVRLGKISPE